METNSTETAQQEQEDPQQLNLFEGTEWWREHWKGMPEFVQEDVSGMKDIIVHFESLEGMKAFSKLVGQTVTLETKMIWYPAAEIDKVEHLRWVDAVPEGGL